MSASESPAPPKQLYCLSCRKFQDICDPVLELTHFLSKKNKIPMQRAAWVAKCAGLKKDGSVCGKSIHKFIKVPPPQEVAEKKPEEVEQKPVEVEQKPVEVPMEEEKPVLAEVTEDLR